ncbi:hypothetical protein EDC01DRAFT_133541 [Geopyxis carbonaria]|nr:hypothetical protein EDC01DRAFT_133541 [Geopyxis carbonaria]
MEDATPIRTSIRSIYARVVHTFNRLIDTFDEAGPSLSQQLNSSAFEDELGHFRLWAGNSGAHRKGRISLDHRLRYSLKLHDTVSQDLEELDDTLQRAIKIIQNGGNTYLYSSSETSSEESSDEEFESVMVEEELPTTTPLQHACEEIELRITCLMRLLVTFRQPAPHDQTAKCAAIPIAHFEEHDINHVSNKYPKAPRYLTERLGRANTKRRQLFKYLKLHHEKIALYVDVPIPIAEKLTDSFEQGARDDQDEYPEEHSVTVQTQTTVTTILETTRKLQELEIDECRSEAGQTETSYAQSEGTPEDHISVPHPPRSAEPLGDRPFPCPFCYYFINPSSTRSWERHVFKDLKPYVCTFEDCIDHTQLFESRREWFNHEVQTHRREWCCAQCEKIFRTRDKFKAHLNTTHPEQYSNSIVNLCERAVLTEQQCPICSKRCQYAKIASHLGRHMQQIALFVLRESSNEEEDEEGGDGPALQEDSESESEEDGKIDVSSSDSVIKEDNRTIALEKAKKYLKLNLAIEMGSVERVLELLNDGSDPNFPWETDEIRLVKDTPLHKAMETGNIEIVSILIKHGADVNAQGSIYGSALQAAAVSGNLQIVHILLRAGADVNAHTKNEFDNALQAAAYNEKTVLLH